MVYELRDSAAAALSSTKAVIESHELFAKSVVDALSRSTESVSSSDSTVNLLRPSEVVALGDKISDHSKELARHTSTMLDQLKALTEHIDSVRRTKEKKTTWSKIWGWLVKAFYVLAGVLAVAAVVAPIAAPGPGIIIGAVLGGGAALASAAAALCKELKEENKRELDKYKALHDFLEKDVPGQAERAERSLKAFESCLRVQQLDVIASQGRVLQMRTSEAIDARDKWKAHQETLTIALQACGDEGEQDSHPGGWSVL